MQIAVDALGGPAAAVVADGGERVEGGAQPGAVGLEDGHGAGGGLQPLVHLGGDHIELRAAQLGGRQRLGERGVHLGGGMAERPRRAGEVRADGQRVQRQLPAVRRARQEGLEHAQRRRLAALLGGRRLVPGGGRRHPRALGVRQGPRQLQIRVDARFDPPEDLQDEGITVDDRGVGLFDGDRPARQPGGDVGIGLPAEAQRAEPARHPQPLQQQPAQPVVEQRVIDGATAQRAAARTADRRVRQLGRQRRMHAQQELVAVAAGRRTARWRALLGADEQQQQAGRARVGARQQLGRREQGEAGDQPSLAGEPALAWYPFGEQGRQRGQQIGCGDERAAIRGVSGGTGRGGVRHGVASFPRAHDI